MKLTSRTKTRVADAVQNNCAWLDSVVTAPARSQHTLDRSTSMWRIGERTPWEACAADPSCVFFRWASSPVRVKCLAAVQGISIEQERWIYEAVAVAAETPTSLEVNSLAEAHFK